MDTELAQLTKLIRSLANNSTLGENKREPNFILRLSANFLCTAIDMVGIGRGLVSFLGIDR